MIIDAIKEVKNIIYTSENFHSLPSKCATSEYSFVKENMVFSVTDPLTTEVYITADFTGNINFRELVYTTTSEIIPTVKCYYSFDNYVYHEFPYITYSLEGSLPDEHENNVLKNYAGKIIHMKKLPNGMRHFTLYNTTNNRLDPVPSADHDILEQLLTDAMADTNSIVRFTYVWSYTNTNLEKAYLYDKEIRFFKAVFTKFSASTLVPFKINSFEVLADESISKITLNNISLFNQNFFKQKYFETYDFVPSIANTYFQMLSYSDREINKAIPDISLDFLLDNIDHTFHLISPTEINIDKYYEPSLVIKVVLYDRFYTFSYTSLQTVYSDINPIINRVLSDTSSYSFIDISVLLHTNKFDIVKQRKYKTPFDYFGDGWLRVNQIGEMTIGEDFYVS